MDVGGFDVGVVVLYKAILIKQAEADTRQKRVFFSKYGKVGRLVHINLHSAAYVSPQAHFARFVEPLRQQK